MSVMSRAAHGLASSWFCRVLAALLFMATHMAWAASPTISSFSPTSGPAGTSVTINGTNFSSTKTSNAVKFNGTSATVTSASTTKLIVTVPSGATSGAIAVTVSGKTATSSSNFTVTTPPTISSFSPTSGPVGASVTITGTKFSTTASNDTVKFNGTAATVTSATSTQLVAIVPAGATSGKISVAVNGQTATSSSSFTVTPPPTITSFTPTSGPIGTAVTITGSRFSATKTSNTVKFNGTAATVSSASTTQLVVTVPTGATTGSITVTVSGQTATSGTNFTVTASAPTISGFTPTSGPVGTAVTISGTNFDSNPANDAVTFNGTAAIATSATATQLVVPVPIGATTGKIKVTIGSQSATSSANFTPTVSITGFSPSSGPIGTTLTIQGQGFSSAASNNAVAFNGTAATVVSTTTTQLTVTVPSGATTGPITVTTGGKTATSSTSFVVAPQVLGFSPASGPVGTSVTITGSNFDPAAANDAVSFNGTVAAVTSASATQLIAVVPAGATSGAISVTVAGATTASAISFTVTPAITSFSPGSGGAGTTVTVTGTSFLPVAGQTTVTLNATPVTPSSLTDTQAVFTVPANAATGAIKITTPSGQAVSAGDFVVSTPGIGPIASSVAIVPDGIAQTLSINAANTSAEFTFDVQADHWLTLAVNSLSTTPSNGSITYEFVDTNNQLVSQGSLSSADVTIQVPPILATGTYQLVFNSGSSNSVSVQATLTSDRVFAIPTVNGVAEFGGGPTQVVGQSFRFTFAANAGDELGLGIVGLQVSPMDGSSSGRKVIVYAPDSTTPLASGSCFDTAETNGNPIVDCDLNLPALQVSGTYSVVVDIGVVGSATWRIGALVISNNIEYIDIPTGSSVSINPYTGQNVTTTFQGTAGESADLILIGTTNKIYFPAGIVYAPDGTQVTTFNVQLVSSAANTPMEAVSLPTLPLSGTYTISLEPLEYGANISLSVDSVATTSNTLIVDGRSNYGVTTVAGQALTYTFTGSVGQNLSLGISSLTLSPTNGSATVTVTQPNKSQSASVSCTSDCLLDLSNLPVDGIYTVTVTPPSNATTVAVATLSSDLTGSLSTSTNFSGSLTRLGQIGKITFAATAGQTLALDFLQAEQNATSYGGQWQFKVMRPNGTVLPLPQGWIYGAGNTLLPMVNLPDSGEYTIQVAPTGDYGLLTFFDMEIELYPPVNLVADTPAVSWNIATSGLMGLYSFSAAAGQNLGLGITIPIGAGGDYSDGATILVYKPDGSIFVAPVGCVGGDLYFFGSTSVGCNIDMSQLNVYGSNPIPVSGIYTVVVVADPLLVNPLFYTTLSSWNTGQLTIDGPTLDVSVPRPGQASAITFEGTVGQILQLHSGGAGTSISGYVDDLSHPLEIYDPNGKAVASTTIPGTTSIDIPTLALSGTYTVYFLLPDGATGTFPLTLATLSSCANRGGPVATSLGNVAAQPSQPTVGQPFNVSATVTPAIPVCGAPAGTVTIIGSNYSSSYECSYDTTLASGCTITAQAAAGLWFYASFTPSDATLFQASNTASDTYVPIESNAAQAVISSISPEPSAAGQPYSLQADVIPVPPATATPTGTVSIQASDGTSCSFVLPATSCSLTAPNAGSVSITATYSGDTNFGQAVSPPMSHTVTAIVTIGTGTATLAITGSNPEPSVNGQSYSVQVTLTPVSPTTTPTGTVTVSDGTTACLITLPATSCSLTTSKVGEVSLYAAYSGDATFAAAQSATIEHIINPTTPTEMCGLDPWATPNDPPGFVPITQLSGIVYTPGIAQDITGNGNLSVTITSPSPSATIADTTVDVAGTFVGPTNTGITVNGVLATTVNGQFLASGVPLAAGTNTLTVTATTLPGATATTSETVTQGGASSSPITFTVDSSTGSGGFAPVTITFDYAVGALPNNATVQSVAIDINGDGTYDFSATSLAALPVNFVYSRPGSYTAALKVIDTNSNTYLAYRSVLIQDLSTQRNMLCDVYAYLKDRLNAQDATGAASAYQPSISSQYQNQFSAWGTNMPSVAATLGVIGDGILGKGFAEITLIRDNSDQTRNGFPMRMTQSGDGVWRISEM